MSWTQEDAVRLCILVESIAPTYGAHVALTGGLLYKPGPRKDADILFYRIRQTPEIDRDGLWKALEKIGLTKKRDFGWCVKAEFDGMKVDCFFPEEPGMEYPENADAILTSTLP